MGKERQATLVGPVMVLRTFRTDDGRLDLDKQRRHLRWLIDQGITTGNGVLMGAGGASEGAFMREHEWKAIVELTAEECKGRVASMAGIFSLSTDDAIERARFLEQVGIDFVQLPPPHYMSPRPDEVFGYYRAVSDVADVGILPYNSTWAMPAPAFELDVAMFERLVELEHIEGASWGSDNLSVYISVARRFSGELGFINNIPLALSIPIKLGMTGFFQPEGNVAPRLVLHMWDMWKHRRYDEFDQFMLETFVDSAFKFRGKTAARWASVGEGPHARAVMETMGLKMGPPFPPQIGVSEEGLDKYREEYEASGLEKWVDWEE